ncbi:MAG: HTTM domain-containing protein [Deltaproteobacteria bacterium]|nr:HTTM domain-containing protein [Deltaproteobacteria bacterium]
MSTILRPWTWFVERCMAPIDLRPLALLRIFVPLCIFFDLLRVAQVGLTKILFTPYAQGGLSQVQDEGLWLHQLVGPERAGPVAYFVTLLCMPLVSLGVAARPAMLIGALAYAQLGHLYPPGDRAIDRVLRMVLIILAFSHSHKVWTWWTWRRGETSDVTGPAWPAGLIRWALCLIYMSAGISKLMQQPRWLAIDGVPVLYRIVTDPLAAHLDPVAWADTRWPFYVGGIGTIVMEVGGFMVLTRWRPWFGLFGAAMHVGIFGSMELGMFSLGMLSLYPLLFDRWMPPPKTQQAR